MRLGGKQAESVLPDELGDLIAEHCRCLRVRVQDQTAFMDADSLMRGFRQYAKAFLALTQRHLRPLALRDVIGRADCSGLSLKLDHGASKIPPALLAAFPDDLEFVPRRRFLALLARTGALSDQGLEVRMDELPQLVGQDLFSSVPR